jgi:hypothetical protein
VLGRFRALVDPAFDVDEHLAQATTLAESVRSKTTTAESAKQEPTVDTQEIDLIEGKIVTIISLLNKAGRKAFRRATDKAIMNTFRYHHLQQTTKTNSTVRRNG